MAIITKENAKKNPKPCAFISCAMYSCSSRKEAPLCLLNYKQWIRPKRIASKYLSGSK